MHVCRSLQKFRRQARPIILPTTFNVDNNVVLLFNVVGPDTFNDDLNVTLLW